MSAKQEVELTFTIVLWKITLMSNYLENGERYDIGTKRGQTENQQ